MGIIYIQTIKIWQEEPPPKVDAERRLTDSPELRGNRTSTDKREEIPDPASVPITPVRCADTTGLSRPSVETPPEPVDNSTPRTSSDVPRTDSVPDVSPPPERETE